MGQLEDVGTQNAVFLLLPHYFSVAEHY